MRPEFVDYLRTAFGVTQPFSFHGNGPFQRASAALDGERDPQILDS